MRLRTELPRLFRQINAFVDTPPEEAFRVALHSLNYPCFNTTIEIQRMRNARIGIRKFWRDSDENATLD